MKRVAVSVFVFFMCLLFLSCEKSNDGWEGGVPEYYPNNPLPIGKDTLRILAIGNSYTIDGTQVLSRLLSETEHKRIGYCVYRIAKAGASLQNWYKDASKNATVEIEKVCGYDFVQQQSATVDELVSLDWDVIVLQQVSNKAYNYKTYNPSLNLLTRYLHEKCGNKAVCLAWQMVWRYDETYEQSGPKGYSRWLAISDATQKMMELNGLDMIIPTGTAIENARNTSLQCEGELTRDGTHLDPGVGRYIAACTWYESLFVPVFGLSTYNLRINYEAPTSFAGEEWLYPSHDVTDENRVLCQKCAVAAVRTPFSITAVDEGVMP